MAVTRSKVVVIDHDKLKRVKDNGGYCLCAIIHDDDTKCMCKTFREAGECQCGVYEKVTIEYKVLVHTDPHPWDNKDAPYFWCVLQSDESGESNAASGWAVSPEEGFQEAMRWLQN